MSADSQIIPQFRRAPNGGWISYGLWSVLIALGYAAGGWIGLHAAVIGPNITLLWPAAGWALAILYLRGGRYWPAVFLGAFLIEATIWPFWMAAGVSVGNTLASWIGAWGLQRIGFRSHFPHRRDALQFLGIAVLGATLISAFNGPFWLALNGVIPASSYPRTVFFWWLGDATGVLVFAPVLLPMLQRCHWNFRLGKLVTSTVIVLLNMLCTGIAFLHQPGAGEQILPIAFLPLLSLTLTAIAYRGWVASNSVLMVGALAILGTSQGWGVFAGFSDYTTVGLLWAFFASIGITTLSIVAVMGEQETIRSALAQGEEQYRVLVEDNPALILRFDSAGRITFANDTSCRFKKLTFDEMLRRSIFELVRGPKAESLHVELQRILSGPGPYAILAPFDDGDGETHWIEWKARKLLGDQFHAVGLDVTARHTAEQEHRRLEQWMFQTQKQESLGLIAGGLAHDFNNLLTGILGHADLASATLPANSPARPHLDRVIESAHRVADSNRQLLAFAGKGKLLDKRIDLGSVIRDAAKELEKDLPTYCSLELRLDEGLLAVMGDQNQMGQAVRNLLLNAVQSQDGRANAVVVHAEGIELDTDAFVDCLSGKAVRPGYTIRVTVSDSGSGIDDTTLARIFDPFFTTKILGRGLGLSAVHGIVSAHGGAVRVDTEPGRGSRFQIIFPAAPALETVPEVALPTAVREPVPPRRSVLVIDDEDSVRLLVVQMVSRLGWEVLSADCGRRGIEGFRGNADRIAFVVLDLTMPDMDGLAVQAALRSIRADVPILFCTGYSSEAIATQEGGGPTALLLKPFMFADLEAAIAALLAKPVKSKRS